MSFGNVQDRSLRTNILSNATYLNGAWVRNPSWLPLASVSSSDQKFSGLYQINRFANFIALNFTTSGAAQYSVNWGDGSAPQLVNSGTQANYEYDFNDVDLAGTDAPVTFTDSTDTVNRTAHGYLNGMNISFATIVSTTGIVATQTYYVVNALSDSFQVSATIGGSPIALTTDGSGTILPYKQAVVTVTPVSGNFTVCNITVKHNQAGLQNGYTTGWLDVAIAGNYTAVTTNSNVSVVLNNTLQQFAINNSNLTSIANLFLNCKTLMNVPAINSRVSITNAASTFQNCISIPAIAANLSWQNFTNTSNMFNSCRSLTSLPIIEVLGSTDMSNMFNSATNLQEVIINSAPNVTTAASAFFNSNCKKIVILKTANLTNASSMFINLKNTPEIVMETTGANTNASQMFSGCNFITAPYFDTSKIRDASSMFYGCTALTDVPPYNLNNANTTFFMFATCNSLRSMPTISISNNINCQSMFEGCVNLFQAPNLDTGNVTTMQSMFNGCVSLQNVPVYNTSKVTVMQSMFYECRSLNTAPNFNTSNVTNMNFMFERATALKNVPLYDTSKATGLQSWLRDTSVSSMPLLNTSNMTSLQAMILDTNITEIPALDCRKLNNMFDTTQSLTRILSYGSVVSFNCVNAKLSGAALNEIYTNLGRVGNGGGATNAVTFQGTADTVTKTAHGYANLDAVRFSTITTTTGISVNTNYYVVNAAADTFQLTNSLTGSPIINLVNDGTGSIADATITVSGNYGTTTDTPAIATAKGWVVTGS